MVVESSAEAIATSIVGALSLLQTVKREFREAPEYVKRQGITAKAQVLPNILKDLEAVLVMHRDSASMLCQRPGQGDGLEGSLELQKLEALVPLLMHTLANVRTVLGVAVDSWSSSSMVPTQCWTDLEQQTLILKQLQAKLTTIVISSSDTGETRWPTTSTGLSLSDSFVEICRKSLLAPRALAREIFCSCGCHATPYQSSPKLTRAVGFFRARFFRCETGSCCAYPAEPEIYHQSRWLQNMAIQLRFPKAAWSIQIRSPRVVPSDSLVIVYSKTGDLPGLQSLLTSGIASMSDMDPFGNNLLHVSLYPNSIQG